MCRSQESRQPLRNGDRRHQRTGFEELSRILRAKFRMPAQSPEKIHSLTYSLFIYYIRHDALHSLEFPFASSFCCIRTPFSLFSYGPQFVIPFAFDGFFSVVEHGLRAFHLHAYTLTYWTSYSDTNVPCIVFCCLARFISNY